MNINRQFQSKNLIRQTHLTFQSQSMVKCEDVRWYSAAAVDIYDVQQQETKQKMNIQ